MALQRLRDVRAVEGAHHKGARFLQNAGGRTRHGPRGDKGAAVGTRIRDGLLRDNKVVPAVLATLALLVFTWLVVAAFVRGGSNEESANQVSLAQNEEESDSGDTESPAPGAENRDTDSYPPFESKDPFRLLKGIESKDGKNGDSKSGEAKNRDGKADNGKASVIGAGGGAAGNNGGEDARDSRDSIDQPLPGGP